MFSDRKVSSIHKNFFSTKHPRMLLMNEHSCMYSITPNIIQIHRKILFHMCETTFLVVVGQCVWLLSTNDDAFAGHMSNKQTFRRSVYLKQDFTFQWNTLKFPCSSIWRHQRMMMLMLPERFFSSFSSVGLQRLPVDPRYTESQLTWPQ